MNNHGALRRITLSLSVAALPLMFAAPALAQDSDEIVVTATRTEEPLRRVPLSVTAMTQEQMDQQGIRQIDDLVRLTPGVTFNRADRTTSISIRGVASSSGAATTGVYIDDTPIQVRQLGNNASNSYPAVFDLERVEVLRGPQGTLFGAGSQGGTVRFITPAPDFEDYSAYGRSEVASTENGDLSYELGAAVGGPVVRNQVAFRASAYYRRDGGWIDKVAGVATVLSPNGSAGPADSIQFTPTGEVENDSNWGETFSARIAVALAPTENLTVTPSLLYQSQHMNDGVQSCWPAMSDYGSSDYQLPLWIGTVDATHIALPNEPRLEPQDDEWYMPALNVQWRFANGEVVSNTSLFSREQRIVSDYTALYSRLFASRPVPLPGDRTYTIFEDEQDNVTQEFRLQTRHFNDRLRVVGGVYYESREQHSEQTGYPNFVSLLPSIRASAIPGFPPPPAAVFDGAPFGPGFSAYVNYYGMDLVNGASYMHELTTSEEQLALFGQLDFNVTERLRFTLGYRVSQIDFEYEAFYSGPNNNQNQPHGLPCVPGTGRPGGAPCIDVPIGAYAPGEGPFEVRYVRNNATSSETPVTPKIGVSYQADPDNLFYFSAAQGFRPGGAQAQVPAICADQLAAFGFFDSTGRPASPETYTSDSVWSYELGAKNSLFNGRLRVDASVYHIDWSDIQTPVSLSACGNSFTANLGSATSRGLDVQFTTEFIDDVHIGLAVSYNESTFDDATVLGGRTLFTKGSALAAAGAPLTVILSGQYDFVIVDRPAYIRGDYTYASEYERTGATDPGTVSYDARRNPRPETQMLNGRLGMLLGDMDVSLFVNNALNENVDLNLSRTNNQPLYTSSTFRPRTIGVAVSLRR